MSFGLQSPMMTYKSETSLNINKTFFSHYSGKMLGYIKMWALQKMPFAEKTGFQWIVTRQEAGRLTCVEVH